LQSTLSKQLPQTENKNKKPTSKTTKQIMSTVDQEKSEKNAQSMKVVLLGQTCVGKSSLVLRFVQDKFFSNTEGTIGGISVILFFFFSSLSSFFALVPPKLSFIPFFSTLLIFPLGVLTAAFLTKNLELDDKVIKFEIWDTAGQERYHSLAPMYYRGAQAAIVAYDITSKVTFLSFHRPPFSFFFGFFLSCSFSCYSFLFASLSLSFFFQESFEKAQQWVDELKEKSNADQIIAFVGNKADLEHQRAVSKTVNSRFFFSPSSLSLFLLSFHAESPLIQDVQKYVTENNLLGMDTSAKLGKNVNELFTEIGKQRKLTFPSFLKPFFLSFCAHSSIFFFFSKETSGGSTSTRAIDNETGIGST
jgi:GTPase SAR1 family protein